MTIRILLVDDQTLVREGVRTLLHLKPGIEVVAEASDGREALNYLDKTEVDVLLLDIRMPNMTGVEVLRKMKEQGSQLAVLVLTTFDDHDLVLECIKLGAQGYLRKDVSFDDLTHAIHQLAEGKSWIKPAISPRINQLASDHLNEHAKEVWRETQESALTEAELQILRLVAAGYSNREIADAIYRSEGTVRNQVSSILTKLDARDRTRAVLKALDNAII